MKRNNCISYSFLRVSYFLVLTSIFIVQGCNPIPRTSFSSKNLGIQFDFPEGWSELSWLELNKQKIQRNKYDIIIIGDPNRRATVKLSDITPLLKDRNFQYLYQCYRYSKLFREAMSGRRKRETLSEEGQKIAEYLGFLTGMFERSASENLTEYKLERRGAITLAGLPVGELVYEGHKPGEKQSWTRLFVMIWKDKVFILRFRVPVEYKEDYVQAFQYIESSWEWID